MTTFIYFSINLIKLLFILIVLTFVVGLFIMTLTMTLKAYRQYIKFKEDIKNA